MEGARCFQGPPVFYVSTESHLAWVKITHQAGIGRSAVRLVATELLARGWAIVNDSPVAVVVHPASAQVW